MRQRVGMKFGMKEGCGGGGERVEEERERRKNRERGWINVFESSTVPSCVKMQETGFHSLRKIKETIFFKRKSFVVVNFSESGVYR